MLFLIATYWVWIVVALLVGGAVGYWSSWRRMWGAVGSWLPWTAIVFVVGLIIAIFHWLPGRAGLYLETLLLLSFWYIVGGLLGSWLRNTQMRAEFATTAKAAEVARQVAAAKTAEDARQAATAKAAEDARQAAAAKAADDARQSAAAKAAEDARQAAAAEDARQAAAAKAAEDARRAAAAKAADDARRAAAAKAADDARQAAAAKAADDARQAAAAKAAEAPSLAAAANASHPGTKPPGIAAPDGGNADNLKLIKGIGPKNEKISNALGVYHFHQIADWTPDEAVWVGHHMAFPGRIEREHWIPQAKLLASGGDTDHSAGVKSGAIVVDDAADSPLDAAAVDRLGKSLPQRAAAVDREAEHAGRRPYGLAAPQGGQPDDLKRIRGIGPQNEGRLHGLGIWHFTQIAAWSRDNVTWVGSYLAFPGRIDREKWIDQARELAAGHQTEFSRRVAAGEVATSKDDGSRGQGNVKNIE